MKRLSAALLSLLGLVSQVKAQTITSYVFTFAADTTQNGGLGINNIQCNQGVLSTTVNLLASVNVNNIHAYQPMAELGLPQIQMSFFLNGVPATSLKLQNSFNVGTTSVVSANTWIFDLADDGPHPGGQFTLGSCTSTAIPQITVQFTTTSMLTTAGLPNGADGGPAVPAITIPTTPQLVNALSSQFVFVAGATFAPTSAAGVTTTSAATSVAISSYVFTFAADPTQNGGQGINALQCNNGWLTATINLLASVNINNIHAYQPMAELGLPQIQMSFFLNGVAGAVTVVNSFNVATSMASGNTWIFDLQDDGPHPGGQFILGQCSGTTVPTVTTTFATSSLLTAAGLPNGADGGPAVPAVTVPTKPTLVNALPSQFVSGSGTAAPAMIATTVTPTMPTAAPTMAGQTTAAAGTGTITIIMSASAYQPQCNNGAWTLFFQGYQVSVTLTSGAITSTNAPMNENGAPQVNMLGYFFLDGVAANLMVSNAVNVANSKTINTNVWSFNFADDQGNIGAAFTLTPTTACTFATALPRITSYFTTSGATIMAPGGNGNPPVTAVPSVVNQLAAANLASPSMAPSGTVTLAPATMPPTAAATTAAPTVAVSTLNCAACTGTSVITITANNAFTPQCVNGVWMLFGIGFSVTVTTSGLGMSFTGPPMAESGAGLYTIDSYWYINGAAAPLTKPQTFNIIDVSTNGNVFSFQTEDDQGTIGGTFGVTPTTACTSASAIPAITIGFGSKTQFTTPGSTQFGIPVITAIPQLVNKLNAANNGGVLNIVGTSSTTSMPTIVSATTKAAATTAKATTAAVATTAKATTGASATTAGASIKITIGSTGSNYNPMCSNGQWALFGIGYSVSVTVNDGKGTVHTAQPMDEAGAGLETISAAWYVNGVATVVTASNTFNVANSMTSGNQWFFTLMDDQPNIGGTIMLAVNPACTSASAAPSITTAFSMANPTTAITTPGGNGVPVVTAIPTVLNNLPVNEQTAATWPTLGASATSSPQAAATTAAATNTVGATINQIITTNIATQGYCTGNFLTVGVGMMISQNGMGPMAENGLPTVTGTVTYNSQMVTIVSFAAYNMQPTLNGAMFTFTEADDQPNVGGQLTLNIPCSYATANGVPSASGIAISYTAASVTINGVTSAVTVNAVPNSVRTSVADPTFAPMPDTGVTTVSQDPNTPATGATSSSSSSSSIIIIAAAAGGGLLLLLAIGAGLYYYKKNQAGKASTTSNVKGIDMATKV